MGATSTRATPFSCASLRASTVGITPSWLPSSSTTRTCGTRIISLMRRSRLRLVPLPCVWGPAGARTRPTLGVAIAEHEHVGHLLLLREPDLVLHAVRAVVHLHPQAARAEDPGQLAGRIEMPVGDGYDDRLDRRAPEGERAGKVLGKDADETLEAAVDRIVDDDRPLDPAGGGAVLQLEPLRQLVVELDGGHLPLPAQRILDEDVDLGGVERTAARIDRVGDAGPVERLGQLALRHLPELIGAQLFLRSRGELEARLEAERAVLTAH